MFFYFETEPTSYPSQIPTEPSISPTKVPTTNPSHTPSEPSISPTEMPTAMPTLPWCFPTCESANCINENENSHCLDQRPWGCRTCEYGYWKESNDHPCVSCDVIPNCNNCKNYAGCVSCKSGYRKTWDTSCGYGVNICKEI